ncbi:hypothetical protein QNO07_03140 [Streptomyces sp. 549]|uniref:hypothetical protein n=1 Tax=Streptomyces sp. 549 TaxID=3049076 RepID=UPI0024C43569|nr:hypothetical protein [Streptomyces sp. 549]MDK1472428.1 hypothetical protein [Streptomyces sp. 549]
MDRDVGHACGHRADAGRAARRPGGGQYGGTGAAWAAVPVGLLNGLLGAWLLGRLAHRRRAARLPETFVRLRYGKDIAAAQQPDGGGWLDRLERGATRTNSERRPVGI